MQYQNSWEGEEFKLSLFGREAGLRCYRDVPLLALVIFYRRPERGVTTGPEAGGWASRSRKGGSVERCSVPPPLLTAKPGLLLGRGVAEERSGEVGRIRRASSLWRLTKRGSSLFVCDPTSLEFLRRGSLPAFPGQAALARDSAGLAELMCSGARGPDRTPACSSSRCRPLVWTSGSSRPRAMGWKLPSLLMPLENSDNRGTLSWRVCWTRPPTGWAPDLFSRDRGRARPLIICIKETALLRYISCWCGSPTSSVQFN